MPKGIFGMLTNSILTLYKFYFDCLFRNYAVGLIASATTPSVTTVKIAIFKFNLKQTNVQSLEIGQIYNLLDILKVFKYFKNHSNCSDCLKINVYDVSSLVSHIKHKRMGKDKKLHRPI